MDVTSIAFVTSSVENVHSVVDNGDAMDDVTDNAVARPLRVTKVLHYTLTVPLALLVVVGNILLWFVLNRSNSLRPHQLMTHLALADAAVGLALLVNECLQPLFEQLSHDLTWICNAWAVLQFLPLMAVFILMALLSFDRHCAVTRPAEYADLWVAKRTRALTCFTWIYSALVVCLMLVVTQSYTDDSGAVFFLNVCNGPTYVHTLLLALGAHVLFVLVATSYLYVRILQVVRLHQNRIQVTNTMTYDNLVKDSNLAKVYFLITMVTAVLWLPFIASMVTYITYDATADWFKANVSQFLLLMAYAGNLHFLYLLMTSSDLRAAFQAHLKRQDDKIFIPSRQSICRHI